MSLPMLQTSLSSCCCLSLWEGGGLTCAFALVLFTRLFVEGWRCRRGRLMIGWLVCRRGGGGRATIVKTTVALVGWNGRARDSCCHLSRVVWFVVVVVVVVTYHEWITNALIYQKNRPICRYRKREWERTVAHCACANCARTNIVKEHNEHVLSEKTAVWAKVA